MRYRLRTLLIVLAVGPMVLAGGWFATAYWREQHEPDGRIDVGSSAAILTFFRSCTFPDDDQEATSVLATDEKSLGDKPIGVDDPASLDPFGMP